MNSAWVTCICGKRTYFSRKEARHAAQGLKGLNAYKCPHSVETAWHLGHLPGPVKDGRMDRSTVGVAKRKPSEQRRGARRAGDC